MLRLVSWDDCAKRLFELEGYKKILKQVTLPATGIIGDLGCGRGYLLKALYEANPQLSIVGVDKQTGECKKFLESARIPFIEIDAKKITKDRRKGRLDAGVYIVTGDYTGMFHRFFDCSFMLFPAISSIKVKDNRAGASAGSLKQNTTAFLSAVQILGRLILVSDATVEGGTFVITNFAEAGAEDEYGRSGLLKDAKSRNIPIKDRDVKALYNKLNENSADPYLYLTVGKASEISDKSCGDIKKLAALSNNGNIGMVPLPKGGFELHRMIGNKPVKKLMSVSKELYAKVLGWFEFKQ